MAYNTSYTTEAVQSLRHSQGFVNTVAESPIIGGLPADGDGVANVPKRPCTHSPPLFGSPDSTPTPHSLGLSLGLETKKLIVSTCRAFVKLEDQMGLFLKIYRSQKRSSFLKMNGLK